MKRKYQQNRIFTPNNPLSPRICPELAQEIGLNESILLLQYEFWMATEGEERQGFLWLRKTVREVRGVFKFWGVATIDRVIQSLLAKGYMVAGDFDEGPGKGGRWMRFDFERLSNLKSIKVDCSTSEQRMFHSEAETDQDGTSVYIEEKTKIEDHKPCALARQAKPVRPKEPDPLAEDRAGLLSFLIEHNGPIRGTGPQTKAINWLLSEADYSADECKRCFAYLSSQAWRGNAITWKTVSDEIGAWKGRGEPSTMVHQNGNGNGNGKGFQTHQTGRRESSEPVAGLNPNLTSRIKRAF